MLNCSQLTKQKSTKSIVDTKNKRRMDYCFSEVVEIHGGESEKVVAAESSNRRHLLFPKSLPSEEEEERQHNYNQRRQALF